MKRFHTLLVFLLLMQVHAFAQDYIQQYNQARSYFEDGQFAVSIRLLKQIEMGIGPTIKTHSLLIYSYINNDQFVEAKIAMEQYKRLASYATGEAHRKLLQQESVIQAGLQWQEDVFRSREMTPQRKMQAAQRAIHATYPRNNSQTPQEIEAIKKYYENSTLMETGYISYKQRVADAAAAALKKKEETLTREQAYFREVALKSITAGNATWTRENLKMTYFRDGTPIVMARNEDDWISYFHAEIPCWRYQNYDPNQDPRLGLEYNMYALMSEKQIAPEGWRVPTINDWKNFSATVGDWQQLYIPDAVFTMGTKDGSKRYGAVYWNTTHRNRKSGVVRLKGKNKSGFSAIPNRSIRFYSNVKDKLDNNKAVWWAMPETNNWLKTSLTANKNVLEVRKDYETEAAAFYFTSTYNDRLVPSPKNQVFVYWNFLKEDYLAQFQKRKPRYADNIYTYDIAKFNTQGQRVPPESYEIRSTDHMQGYPIRLVR